MPIANICPFVTYQVQNQSTYSVICTIDIKKSWGSLQSVEYADGVFLGYADSRRPGASAKGVFKTKKKVK